MKTVSAINFGETIKSIFLIPSKYKYDDSFIYKSIIIETNQFIVFDADNDFDEIKISIFNENKKEVPSNAIEFKHFNGRKLTCVWIAQNCLGAFDLVIIGVDIIRPTVTLLCECGSIAFFKNDILEEI